MIEHLCTVRNGEFGIKKTNYMEALPIRLNDARVHVINEEAR